MRGESITSAAGKCTADAASDDVEVPACSMPTGSYGGLCADLAPLLSAQAAWRCMLAM